MVRHSLWSYFPRGWYSEPLSDHCCHQLLCSVWVHVRPTLCRVSGSAEVNTYWIRREGLLHVDFLVREHRTWSRNRTTKGVLVAFLCLWTFSFGVFISSSSWLSSNEVHSVRLRAYAQPFVGSIAQTTAFAASFWTPYMLNVHYGNMGSNAGYFYLGISVGIWILVFWLAPETTGSTLEQVDDIFASKIRPWHTSVRRNQRIHEGKEVNLSKE